jgi:selenide,water dikinase
MLPGCVAGRYRAEELEIDLEHLCRSSGAEWVPARASAVDAGSGKIVLDGGSTVLGYDVASLDIGSRIAGEDLPGVAECALPARPAAKLLRELGALVAHARSSRAPFRANVVGGGAGGVELAFCLDARLRREGVEPVEVTIITAESRLLASGAPALSRQLRRTADRRGLRILTDARVRSLAPGLVRLEDGRELVSDAVLWATGPAARPLGASSGLPVDERGFIRIENTFQVRGQADLFAVGDCASLPGMARAGVYAVRAGPLLDHNLRARAEGRPLRGYRPQPDFLSLLNLGDGTALGVKWGRVVRGRTVMWLKDRIDRTFMARYR